MSEKKVYYYVNDDDGRCFFEYSENFLQFLRDNDECECGSEELTPEQWSKIKAADLDNKVPY